MNMTKNRMQIVHTHTHYDDIRFVTFVSEIMINQITNKVYINDVLAIHPHSQHDCHGLHIYQRQHGVLRK